MDFDAIFTAQLTQLKEEGNYRIFEIGRAHV